MESFKDLFELVKAYCRERISKTVYDLWITCLEPISLEGNRAVFRVRTEFQRGLILEKYSSLLKEAFESVLGFPVELVIECGETASPPLSATNPSDSDEDGDEDPQYEYTFETFIVGSSNKFAHAASLAVATNPSGAYNPLFIYGASGLGKTHLLYAIYHEIERTHPQNKIIYVHGEEFTNELIEAIQNRTTAEFHAKYRLVDVLLVDDIQFIAGKEQTQEEFFHTFNNLYQAGKQIVLTSDRPPKEIKTLEDRLLTRFESGLLADVSAPDFETRIAIIRRKAELLKIEVPNDVADYMANRLKNNIRQLEGAVKKLKAIKFLSGTAITITVAQNAIRDILNDNQPVPVTVERIINEVARTYGVRPEDIRSNKRSAPISSARQVSVYVVREITQMSMSAIGEEFGGRDHSTIVYAVQQVDKNMKIDRKYKGTVEDIIKNIRDH